MINKWMKSFLYIVAFVAITIVLLFNIIYINNITNTEISNIERYKITYLIVSTVIALGLIVTSYFIEKIKISSEIKVITIILSLATYAILQIIWIHHSIALPYADSEQILIIAEGLIGKKELIPYCFMYLQYYPQQLTLSVIIAFIFKICNSTNYIILQYINVICNIFTVLGLYAIIKNLSEKYKINKTLFFIMILTYFPIIFLSTFIYGDFIGLAFVIWSIYFAMKYARKEKKRYVAITGILMLIACLVRMNYFIFAIAIIIYWLIDLLEKTKKQAKQVIVSLGMIILLIAIILLPNKLIKNKYQQKYNLNSEKSFSTIPYLYMGMSEGERGNGWYNAEVGDIVYHLMCDDKEEAEKMNEKCIADLKSRIRFFMENPIDTFKFYKNKIVSIWAEPTMELGFYNSTYPEDTNLEEHKLVEEILEGRTYKIIQIYQKGLIILVLIGAILAILLDRKKLNKDILLLCLIFLGGFTFHLLWEAKSRYIIPYFVILIPIALIGIGETIEIFKTKIEKQIKKKKGDYLDKNE